MATEKSNTPRAPRMTTGWVVGECWTDDRKYPSINPPRPTERRRRPAPPVEQDVPYGPFTIRCMYRTRDCANPTKAGYMVLHTATGAAWTGFLYHSVPDARAFGMAIARAFDWSPWFPETDASAEQVA